MPFPFNGLGRGRQAGLPAGRAAPRQPAVLLCLPGRLLSQADALPPGLLPLRKLRQLLPQADALPPVFSGVLDVRRLLPQADAEPVLARAVQYGLRQLLRTLLDVQSGRHRTHEQPDSRNEAHGGQKLRGQQRRGRPRFVPLITSGIALPAASQ